MRPDDVKVEFKATAELYGRTMSDAAYAMLAVDLQAFTPRQICGALSRCRKELKAFPSVAEIIARIDDTRPGVEEAWSIIPKDEYSSIVWTDEMAEAFGPARELLAQGDPIAARMAFKECYPRLVADARARGKRANWWLSAGHASSGRDSAVQEAVQKGRITQQQAVAMIGHDPAPRREKGEGQLTSLSDTLKQIEHVKNAVDKRS